MTGGTEVSREGVGDLGWLAKSLVLMAWFRLQGCLHAPSKMMLSPTCPRAM